MSVNEAVHEMVGNLPGAKLLDWTSAESTLLPENADNGKVSTILCKCFGKLLMVADHEAYPPYSKLG